MNLDYDEAWDAADDAGVREGMTNDYSGRGMYGERCFGIRISQISEALVFACSLGEGHRGMLDAAQMDAMGRGFIVYFPGYLLDRDPEPAPRDY